MRSHSPKIVGVCFLAPLVLFGCGMSAGVALGKTAVDEFHTRYNAAQYEAIYDAADPEWRNAMDRETSRKFFERVHRKLGSCSKTTNTGYVYNTTTGGTFVNLHYTATCSSGTLEEDFRIKLEGQKGLLIGYTANSPLLLTD